MTKEQAIGVLREFERLCEKHGLFSTVEFRKTPDLKLIAIKEITIKVTEATEDRPLR